MRRSEMEQVGRIQTGIQARVQVLVEVRRWVQPKGMMSALLLDCRHPRLPHRRHRQTDLLPKGILALELPTLLWWSCVCVHGDVG